jgi:hypothetical protein
MALAGGTARRLPFDKSSLALPDQRMPSSSNHQCNIIGDLLSVRESYFASAESVLPSA